MRCATLLTLVVLIAHTVTLHAEDADEVREKGIAATRQLAKRQLTWLRSLPGIEALDPDSPGTFETIRSALAGRDRILKASGTTVD